MAIARKSLIVALVLSASAAIASPDTDALRSAETALSRGDTIAAQANLRGALGNGASKADIAALMGESALLQGDTQEARRWLLPADLKGTYRVRGLRALARLEQREGNLNAAADALKLALATSGDRADIWTDIARLRYSAGNHNGAIEAIDFAIGLDEPSVDALLYKAQLVRDSEGLRAALVWVDQAEQLAPDDMAVLGEYAATLCDVGRASEALEFTRRMLKIDPRNSRAFFIQAIIAARAGKSALARRLYARTDQAFADLPAGMLLSGMLEQRAGASRVGSEQLFDLFEIAPQIAAPELAAALLSDGDAVEVNARFSGAIDTGKASPAVAWQLVRGFEQLGERGASARTFDRAVQWSWGGAVLQDDADQLDSIGRAYEADPANIDTATAYVQTLIGARQDERALSVARELAGRHPGNYYSRLALGDAALASGNAEQAEYSYKAAAEIRKGPLLARKLALALLDRRNVTGAQAMLADYIAQHPLGRDIPTLLGTLLLREGKAEAAARLLNATYPEARRDPLGLARLAWAQLRSGDTETAEKNARAAYAMQRSSVVAAMVLAATLETGGGNAEAIRTLRAKRGSISPKAALAPLFAL